MRKMRIALALVVSAFMTCFTQAQNVAKIGDTEYATIGAAINAAGESDTVELLSNVDVSGYFVYNKNYTIDGKGYTIKCLSPNTNYPNYFVNVSGYTQTFKNVTLDANEKVPYAVQCINAGSKLILDNVTIKGGKSMKTKGKNDSYSKQRLGYGIHVNQGTVIAKDLTVKNCTVLPVYLDGASSSMSLSGDKCNLDLIGTAGLDETVSSSAKGFYAYEVTASYKFIWTSTKEVRVISSLPWNEVISKVGNYTDITVKSATVKLLQDVVLSETFTSNDTKLTIDGNNKAITGTIKFTTSPSTIKNVVLGDGTTLDCTASTNTGFSGVSVAANATIDILLPSTTDISKYSLPVSLGANAIANITVGDKKYIAKGDVITPAETLAQVGDKQYATLQAAIDAANGATIHVLKDVALTASLNIPAGKTLTLNLAGRKVTITGADYALINNGTLTIIDQALVAVVEETSAQNDDVVSFLITCAAANDGVVALDDATGGSIAGVQNKGTFALESGVVVAASASVPAIDNTANAVATITGGTVEGKLQSVDKSALTVTGGSFTGDSNVSDFVGGNYGVDSNGTVISYVAQLGATKYQTLQEAFAAAKEFDVVTVLDAEADVSGIAGYVAEGLFPISNGDKTYTLRAMPAATVEKLPAFTLTKARDAYACWPEGDTAIDRPLDIVMNFLANDDGKAEANETGFADWKCDFYLTFSGMAGASLEADDCYLAGNYGGFGWIVIPADDTIIDNNATLPVVAAYDANITYRQVCDTVKKFTAAIHVADAVMTANPNLKITLQLKMTNNKDASQELVVGSYTYTIEDLKGEFNPTVKVEDGATVTDTFKETVGNGLANAYQATEGKLEVTVVEQAETFATLDVSVSATDGYEVPAEGLEMTFPAQSVKDNEPAIIVHKHEGKYYVTTALVEYGFVTYNNTLGFSEFIVGDVAALNAALAEGGEVILSSDIVLTETLTIPAGKTVTLDLNGKSISMEESIVTTTYALNNLGTLTLKDSVGTGSVNARGIYNGYGNGGDNVPSAKLIVESGTYNAKGTNGGAAIFNYGIAEINGGNFTSIGGYSLNNQSGSSMTIADGVTANNGIYCSNAKVTVNGGNISGNRSGCHVIYAWNSNVTINGGEFYNNNSGNATIMAAGSSVLTINNGTFGIKDGRVPGNGNTWTSCLTDTANTATMTVNGGTFNGGFRVQSGTTMTINGGSFNDCYGSKYNIYGTVTVKGGTFTDATAKTFATNNLADGFKLGENGQVVEDPKNIEVTDANGNVTYYAGFTGFSDLDLADCTIKLLNNVSDANLILNKGDTNVTLDLNGYTFSRTGSSSGAISLTQGAGLTIRDSSDAKTGKILVDTYAVWMMNGDFVLESGTIETTSTKNAAIYANAAEVAITAGKIISAGNAITVGENFMESRGTSTIEISGGEIVAAGVGIKNGSYAQTETAVTVTGGTIDSEGDSISFTTGAVQVSGGTFSSDVSDYCVDGFEVKQNADGSYGVAANPAYGKVAKIGDAYYATFADAVTAANEITDVQVTITMLADAEFDGDDLYANLVLDLNGKTITATGDYVFWFEGGSLTVKDSSAEQTGMIDGSATVGNAFLLMGEESLTIESGQIHANNNVIYTYGSGVTVTINGGELKSYIDSGNIFYLVGANDKITVNGGTFIGNVNPYSAGLSIYGGQFTADVNAYCAANRGAVKNGDGMYEIIEINASNAAAQIGDKYYLTLGAAINAAGDNDTIYVLKDVSESLPTLRGKILPANGSVTITATNSDWLYCAYTFVIGEGVTLNVPALFYYAGGAQINGTLIVESYYQRYAGTKLTINEPGSMTVTGETFILRDTGGDANAGIYVVGDNDDSTIGLKASVIYFYQGMINAKDATIVCGTYWQTQETDADAFANAGSANLVLDNSVMNVTSENLFKATGNSTVTLTNGSVVTVASGYQGVAVSMDATSTFTKNGQPIFVAKIGDKCYNSLQAAIDAAGEGDTITLTADISYVNVSSTADTTTAINIPAGKKFTLDLNGYTISGENDANKSFAFMTICRGADVTIDDTSANETGKITYKSTRTEANENHEGYTIRNQGNLTLNGGKIENATELASNGTEKCVTVAVNNGTSSSGKAATFTMNGGEVVSETYFAIRSNVYANNTVDADAVVVALNGGTVYGLHFCDWGTANLNYQVAVGENAVVECGKYPDYPGQSLRLVNAAKETTVVSVEIAENAQVKGDIYSAGTKAKIGNRCYTKLAAAINAAQAGDEIVLLADATVEETLALPAGITIKSNGKTINGSIRMLGDLELNGPLTITGGLWVGKSGETLTATLSGDKLTASYFMFQHGTYTINADIDAVYGYLSYNGTFEVNSTIHTTGANGEVLYINGNVTLNDGAVLDSDNSVFVCNDNAVLTLKAGSKVDSNVSITTSGAKVNIDATGMTAGEFTNITGTVTNSGNGSIAVVGNDTLEAKIVGGKIVLSAKPVAKIGDTPYATLEDAFKAATEGCTIEILSDVTIDYKWDCRDYATGGSHSQFKEVVTINGNGHTLKFTGTISDGNWMTIFRFEENATVNNLTVDISEATGAQRVISAKKSLTVDGLTIVGDAKYGIIFGEGASATELAASEIVVKNSTLTGTRRAISDNEGGKDVKSVVITGNNLKANVYASASESITFNNNTAAGEVDLRSYTAENVLSVEAKDNTLTAGVKNYIYAKDIDAQEGFTSERPWDGVTIANLKQLKMFRDAVNAGDTYAGKTVTLTADIDMSGVNWVGIGSINQDHGFMGNFDGNGFKIKNLTITNPTLVGGYAYAGFFSITEGTEAAQNVIKNLTIENVTIETTGHIVSAAIAYPYYTIVENVKVCGDINIKGGDYTAGALAYTRRCVNAKDISVVGNAGSTITGAQVVGGVISDIQMNGGLTAVYSNFSAENLTIKGTSMIGGISGIIATQTLNGATVKNVTIDCSDRVGQVAGSFGGTCTISNIVVENVTGADVIIGAAYDGAAPVQAKIGDTFYATLQDALSAQGDEITLLAPFVVEAGETVVLDLAGKTISMVQSQTVTKNHEMIRNCGDLTIQDTVGGGKISYTYTGGNLGTTYAANTISTEPGSVLTVKSGTIENLSYDSATIAYAIDGRTNGGTGDVTVNIEGGTITSLRQAVRIFANSTTNTGALNISGGDITGRVIVQNASAKANKAALSITGGTFNANAYKTDVLYVGGSNSATIDIDASVTGGTFKGEITETHVTGFITGGTYKTDVSDYCAEGYGVKQNADGTYGIQLTSLNIATLEELKSFRDSVNTGTTYEGVTVYLTADIDLGNAEWTPIGSAAQPHGFMGNFDGNGKTIKNLTIKNITLDSDGYAYAGFFGVTEGTDKDNQNTIKNLTIENVTIETTGHIVSAAIAYPYYTIVENVTVCGNINIKGGDYTAGALAYTLRCMNASNISVIGNAVSTSVIEGTRVVGGVISDIQMNGGLTADYSNFTAKNLTIKGTSMVGGIAGLISKQTLKGAIVKNVKLESGDSRVGQVVGSLGGTSTVSDIVVDGVTGATVAIGATYDGAVAVQAQIGDTFYTTAETARKDAETLAETLVATGDKKGVDAFNTMYLLGGSFVEEDGKLVYDYAFGVSNVAYVGGEKPFKVTVAIKDADSTAARTLTGRKLVLRMVVENEDGTIAKEVVEKISNPVFTVAADGQVTCDVLVDLPTEGEGKATYFTVKVID